MRKYLIIGLVLVLVLISGCREKYLIEKYAGEKIPIEGDVYNFIQNESVSDKDTLEVLVTFNDNFTKDMQSDLIKKYLDNTNIETSTGFNGFIGKLNKKEIEILLNNPNVIDIRYRYESVI